MIEIIPQEISDVLLIKPPKFGDHRGFFSEVYNKKQLQDAGLEANFVQDNHSFSAERGVLRGLHFQTEPEPQGKLVRVTRGAVFDVAVDVRKDSPTFGHHVSTILSAVNWHQVWIPAGFAHGFCTLEANTEVLYKTTGYYAPDCEVGIIWDDPDLAIDWPVAGDQIILSEKDKALRSLASFPVDNLFSCT